MEDYKAYNYNIVHILKLPFNKLNLNYTKYEYTIISSSKSRLYM